MRLFKIELTKAVKNKYFISALTVGVLLCLCFAGYSVGSYFDALEKSSLIANESGVLLNPMSASHTLYNRWIGQEWVSPSSSLFFLLLPLISALPYSRSYAEEVKSGYLNNIFIRTHKSKFLISKFFSAFSVGAVVVAIPLILNVMTVSAFIPAVKPNVYCDVYYNMPVNCVFSEMFYKMPLLFVLLKITLISFYAGCFSVLGLSIGMLFKNKFVAVLFPFVFMLLFNYISNVFSPDSELSPIQFLYGGGDVLSNIYVLITELLVLFFVPLVITKAVAMKKDAL